MKSRRRERAERRPRVMLARHRLLDIEQFRRDRRKRACRARDGRPARERREVGILLVGIQRDAVIMGQRGQLPADSDQARGIVLGIAVELELEIAAPAFSLLSAMPPSPSIVSSRPTVWRIATRSSRRRLASSEESRRCHRHARSGDSRASMPAILSRHAVEEIDAGARNSASRIALSISAGP